MICGHFGKKLKLGLSLLLCCWLLFLGCFTLKAETNYSTNDPTINELLSLISDLKLLINQRTNDLENLKQEKKLTEEQLQLLSQNLTQAEQNLKTAEQRLAEATKHISDLENSLTNREKQLSDLRLEISKSQKLLEDWKKLSEEYRKQAEKQISDLSWHWDLYGGLKSDFHINHPVIGVMYDMPLFWKFHGSIGVEFETDTGNGEFKALLHLKF